MESGPGFKVEGEANGQVRRGGGRPRFPIGAGEGAPPPQLLSTRARRRGEGGVMRMTGGPGNGGKRLMFKI